MLKYSTFTPFTKAGAAVDTACTTALDPMWLGKKTAAAATLERRERAHQGACLVHVRRTTRARPPAAPRCLPPHRRWLAAWRRRETLIAYAFVAPWLIGMCAFYLGPMIASFVYSFTDYPIIAKPHWAGLANYRTLSRRRPVPRRARGDGDLHARLGRALRRRRARPRAALQHAACPGSG